jgi:putative endonuclease
MPTPAVRRQRGSDSRAELGLRAENAAADYLRAHGYRLLEGNYRCRTGEIDLIAEDERGVLCFIEVRSRTRTAVDFGRPLETIGLRKQQRIIRAAEHYLVARGVDLERAMRFDVVGVLYDDESVTLELVRDAFATN